ncbi:MAG: RIP metalloprotease RseP [Deltaproteobacteria bacterium]|nr:RIP metalloprotease RseP [Deltaproteobacteria bacterium]
MLGINIVSVIIVLGILIFVHELGHFLVAKLFGVGVMKFSLGFGPKIVGRKFGETEYVLSAVPLGGYVRLLGEAGTDDIAPEDEKRSFLKQPVSKKIGIVIAGPLFNFLFAILVFALIFSVGVSVLTSRVGEVLEESAALEAGLEKDDVIIAVDGERISYWSQLSDRIHESGGRTLILTVERQGRTLQIAVQPRLVAGPNIFGEAVDSYQIGIGASDETVIERRNPLSALVAGVGQTWSWTKLICVGVVKIIEGVISPRELGGPILIAQMAGTQAKRGILPFMYFMAVISINLGVLNLLPIPVLDGGHLLFYCIELVTGREVNVRWREIAQQVGFFILILLMLFVFYNDIVRIFGD